MNFEPNWYVFCPDKGAPHYFPASDNAEAQQIAAKRFRDRPGALFAFDPENRYDKASTTMRAKLQGARTS